MVRPIEQNHCQIVQCDNIGGVCFEHFAVEGRRVVGPLLEHSQVGQCQERRHGLLELSGLFQPRDGRQQQLFNTLLTTRLIRTASQDRDTQLRQRDWIGGGRDSVPRSPGPRRIAGSARGTWPAREAFSAPLWLACDNSLRPRPAILARQRRWRRDALRHRPRC